MRKNKRIPKGKVDPSSLSHFSKSFTSDSTANTDDCEIIMCYSPSATYSSANTTAFATLVGDVNLYNPNNQQPQNMPKFNKGDLVYLTHEDFIPTENYPVYESPYSCKGKISDLSSSRVLVNWENGQQQVYDIEYLTLASTLDKAKIPPKPIKFDFTHLERVVLEPTAKEEIVAVMKQHENSTKIFEEWGLSETVEYGKGMTFLFYGGPGTGKTWMANCMAKAMGKDMIPIGAAEIQTSEPGGANRNIQDAFKEAKKTGKLLFFDECDSLITSRNDVGMVLGSEINTLLTEIEKFEGVCVLATNRIDTLDEALERRISLIVEFPNPNFEQRKDIWDKMLPKKMPLGKDVKVEKLAEYSLSGGQIKNAVLQSARLAVADESDKVELKYFDAAIKRINASKSLMGNASRYRQTITSELVKSAGQMQKVKRPSVDKIKV